MNAAIYFKLDKTAMEFSSEADLLRILNVDKLSDKINTKFRNEISVSGYEGNVVKSAIQKYIRRNNVEMALKMIMEIYCFEYLDGGKRIFTNGLHRLQIIFLEDIGCGNLELWHKMCEWFDVIYNERSKNDRNRETEIKMLKNIVVNLCKSKKIRGGSFMNAICSLSKQDKNKIKNCEYVEDVYIGENCVDMLKNLDIWLSGKKWQSIIVLRELLKKIKELKGMEKRTISNEMDKIVGKYFRFMSNAKKWEKDIGHLKEGYLLYFVQLCDYLYGCDELQYVEECGNGKWDGNMIGKVKLDDYVYDMHVRNGLNRSKSYFVNTSSMVEPVAKNVGLPREFEIIYKWKKETTDDILVFDEQIKKKKKMWVFPNKESDLEFVCRAQLVTSYSKVDTYYAKGIDFDKEQLWLIKGPYMKKDDIDEFIKYQKIKKELKLPYIQCYMKKMKVDRWPERNGIGLRLKFKVDEDGYFMICKSVVKEEQLERIIHPGTKKWNATEVVDLKKFSVNSAELNETQMLCFLNTIGFRVKYNIGDLADRNFIVVGDKIYSVDETTSQNKINLLAQFKRKKYLYIKAKFELYKDKLNKNVLDYLCVGFSE
jgi:hypothetical protein